MPIPLWVDFYAQMVRSSARRSKGGSRVWRRLERARFYEAATRTQAAKIGGVTLQIIRDWEMKFNAQGSQSLIDRKPPGQLPG
jgi:transposase